MHLLHFCATAKEFTGCEMPGRKWCSIVCSELHCSKFWLARDDWKRFVYSPWLPEWWQTQLVYLVYRWMLMLYFLAWLVVTGVDAITSGFGAKYLIYISYWAFLIWNIYLIAAVISTTAWFLHVHSGFCKKDDYRESTWEIKNDLSDYEKSSSQGGTWWFNKLHWVFFTLGTELAVGISILFWLFFYDPERTDYLFSPIILHMHMINGISALADLWIVNIPVRLLHVVYPIAFGTMYAAFTGLYYVFNGTDESGNHYIYPILDYGSNPGVAVKLLIGCILGFLTIIHLLFFLMYVVRNWITQRLYAARDKSRSRSPYATPVEDAECSERGQLTPELIT